MFHQASGYPSVRVYDKPCGGAALVGEIPKGEHGWWTDTVTDPDGNQFLQVWQGGGTMYILYIQYKYIT